jgi:hypothetical protein
MQSNNFVIEHKIKFLTNKGDYPHQPIFTMVDNTTLTSSDFISLSRMRRSEEESNSITALVTNASAAATASDGILVLTVGTSGGVYSASGTTRIRSMSITSANDGLESVPENSLSTKQSTTSEPIEYTIATNLSNSDRIDVIVNDGQVFFGDISLSGFPQLSDMDYMGNAFRPQAEKGTSPDGSSGNSLVLQYIFNREEIGTSSLSAKQIADKSGNGLNGSIFGRGLGTGNFESGTITGWVAGPIEGGFKFDGNITSPTYIESASSSIFNTFHGTTSGMTIMAHVKLNSTGDTNIIAVGGSSDVTILGMLIKEGSLVVSAGFDSVTAGSVSSRTNHQSGAAGFPIGRWTHIAARVSMTGSERGTTIFLNGTPTNIARSTQTITGDMTQVQEANEDASIFMGVGVDRVTSAMTGSIASVRVFNSALSDAAIFKNYISSIPSHTVINSIKIG